ncbi:hypothetical protein ACQPZX_10785 [Actinoplanes sp. CA-142083]|uniref:hypothetical protein n=1 Tax=Actinoplanes sp. CA-142083 TaxID=3239903 RepID=UPI003D91ECAD
MQAPSDLALLSEFFDRYGVALTTGDIAAVAGCYALPGMVVADSYSFTFTSPAAVALSFLGAAPTYRDQRIIAANAEFLDVRQLSEALTLVAVEWEYLDSDGQALTGERFHYLLPTDSSGPRITTVVATH